MKAYAAEALGTALLVIGGCGAAIFAGGSYGALGISIAFGLSLTLIAYLIGGISGGHVNPAVTLVLALTDKFPWKNVPGYMVSQIGGGIVGGGILYTIAKTISGFDVASSGFATNMVNPQITLVTALLIEIVMTTILCLAVLATTRKGFPAASTPIAVGVALTLVHLISIPFTNTSVNPARSIGVAVFVPSSWGIQWVFIVAPALGAILAYLLYAYILDDKTPKIRFIKKREIPEEITPSPETESPA